MYAAIPPPAPDPTMQTSYVFRCGNGREEEPRVIAHPQLRTRETTTRRGQALGPADIIFVMET